MQDIQKKSVIGRVEFDFPFFECLHFFDRRSVSSLGATAQKGDERLTAEEVFSMTKQVFDAGSFMEVDLVSGSIFSKGRDRLALVSLDILKFLPESEALHQAAAEWGRRHGRLLSEQLKKDAGPDDAGMETLSGHLGGTLAAFGMGRLRVEIRGDAMLFRTEMENNDESAQGTWTLLGGFLSGYLSGLTGLPFAVLDLGPISQGRLFWAGNPKTAVAVQSRLDAGSAPFAAVDEAATGGLSC
jgi:hypothetical protein